MPDEKDTQGQGSDAGDSNKDTPGQGSDSQGDQGSESKGLDTPLNEDANFGGKYGTVGDLVTAHKSLQGKLEEKADADNPEKKETEKKETDPEAEKPLTRADLETHTKQQAEEVKLAKTCTSLGLTDAQKTALAGYSERPENLEKDFADLALELGFATEDKVAIAKGQTKTEKGGAIPGKGAKSLGDANSVEEVNEAIDDMSDEEFIAETDEMAGKTAKEGEFQYT